MERKIGALAVDMPNDFFKPGPMGVEGAEKIISPINRFIAEVNKVGGFEKEAATFDLHHPDSDHFITSKLPPDPKRPRWKVHCVAGTLGAEPRKDINLDGFKRFYKGQEQFNDDGYDPFEGVSDDGQTLHEYLGPPEDLDILYIFGLATDYCVKYGVESAIKLGYNVHVLIDAVAAIDLQLGDKALEEFKKAGAVVETTDQAIIRERSYHVKNKL